LEEEGEGFDPFFAGERMADEPIPEFADSASAEGSALDGLLCESTRALLDILLHDLIGKDVGLEVATIAFFVGVGGAGEVEGAAELVVGAARIGAFVERGRILVGRQGGDGGRDEATPERGGRFEGLMAVLAAATLHDIGFFVAGVLAGREAACRSFEGFAEEGVVKPMSAASLRGKF
jgi:hypothetical protein